MVIAGAINRISATAALALFFVYAASLGITIGLIVASYTTGLGRDRVPERVGDVRCGGRLRPRDPAHRWRRIGGILFMGVIGLLVAMLLNLFLHSSPITWLISIVGVVLFTALTAYDVQRIQSGDLAARLGSMEKAAVIGALQLYLDFINLFLFMLRLMGGRS